MRGAGKDQLLQIGRDAFHRVRDFAIRLDAVERVPTRLPSRQATDSFTSSQLPADAAERAVHVREQRTGLHAGFVGQSHQRLGQLMRFFQRGHEGRSAEFDSEHQGLEALGQLFGEDRRDDQRNGRDSSSRIAQGVEGFVRRHHAGGLAADDATNGLNNLHDALRGGQALEGGYGIELVECAAGDAEPAPGDHRHTKTEARQQRSQRERDFVPDPAGGMLVHQGAGSSICNRTK